MTHHPLCAWWRLDFSRAKPCPMCALRAEIESRTDRP